MKQVTTSWPDNLAHLLSADTPSCFGPRKQIACFAWWPITFSHLRPFQLLTQLAVGRFCALIAPNQLS